MFTHDFEIRVSYADTDQMGVVYYSNYFIWFERGRTELLREIGLPYKNLEKENLFLPVVETYCSYKVPAQYDDIIIVRTRIEKIGKSSIIFTYEILRKLDSEFLACGETTHAFINRNKKVIRIPAEVKSKLNM